MVKIYLLISLFYLSCLGYGGYLGVGAAYIYELRSNKWTMTASILSPSVYLQNSLGTKTYTGAGPSKIVSQFGFSVSIYGNYALVGAPVYSKNITILILIQINF